MAGSISFATSTVTATETLHETFFTYETASPVYIDLSTSVPIYVTPTPLPTPYVPNYQLLRDGSLITPLFVNDFVFDKMRLVLMGVFGMLFTRNLFIAIDYTIRVKIKHKTLFYLLIGSQFCALPTIAALAAPFFLQEARCDITTIVAAVFCQLSVTLQIPGIFGIKVYRFLGQPQIVPVTLGTLHVAALVLFFSDVPNLVEGRKLTGSCTTQGDIPRMILGVALIEIEILFICSCFAYAVWRAKKYPEAKGRTSIRLSLDPETHDNAFNWDVFVRPLGNNSEQIDRDSRQLGKKRPSPIVCVIMALFGDKDLIDIPQYIPRKPSTPTIEPILMGRKRRRSWRDFPRMFRIPDALKSELTYTTLIAISCATTSSIVVAGLFYVKLFGGPFAWVGLTWSVTSLLILHNFSRLVRRNERDRILQEPAAWNPMPNQPAMTQLNRPPIRPSGTSVSISFLQSPPQSQYSTLSRPPDRDRERAEDRQHVRVSEDPFADFEMVQPRTVSWGSHDKVLSGSLAPKPPKVQ